MKRRARRVISKSEENYWPSFTDMISTIAIILFLLVFIMHINNIVTGSQLKESRVKITEAQDLLFLLETELEKTAMELEAGQRELALSQEKIDHQKYVIAQSNQELGDLRQELKGIALLRLEVLTGVKDSVESVMGTTNIHGDPLVTIGSNGNIIINEGLVFERHSYEIKEEGKELLDQLAIAFEKMLEDPNNREHIDAINIQGHTDERGTGDSNRTLGSRRANSVVNYLMTSNPTLERDYPEYFLASTFSEYRPIDSGTTEEAYARNRRIEISIILKDSEIEKIIDNYLKEAQKIFD